jgi:glycosyltransferase involved in cell wall biosynthesis
MNVLVIVPAYNEEKNISGVIKTLHKNGKYDVIVVNDGSKDRTAEIARETGKAFVADLTCNLGIGGAVQTGLKFARNNGYDVAIQFDGDGQHKAEEIRKLLGPISKGEADVVIGSRFIERYDGFRSTLTRRMGIKVFECLNYLLMRQRVTDNTSGFRAYNRDALVFLADNYPTDYPEPEAVVLLLKNKFVIKEVFTEMLERSGGESSINGLKSAYYMIKVVLAILFASIRPKIRKEV